MARIKLTAGRIREYTAPPCTQQAYLWDSEAPGLAVRATKTAKVFIFQGRLNGTVIRVKIGDVRALGIDEARDESRRLLKLINEGIDPRQEKVDQIAAAEARQEAAKRIAAPALDAWQQYIEDRRPVWSDRHRLEHEAIAKIGGDLRKQGRRPGESEKTLPGMLRPLLILPIDHIDGARVRAWLKDEATHRPTAARLAFSLLRAFLNWCSHRPEYQDQVQADTCLTSTARETLPKKTAKSDCLQREQLPAWFANVRRIQNPVIAACLQTTLLTGARREEVTGIRWEHVDFQWKSLTIKDKVDGERTIPLTPYVSALLAALPRRNEWVFSSPAAASGRLQEPRIMHNKALTSAGLPALSIHGLRRSFGTLAEWVECPVGVSAQIMGHKPSATAEKHYRVRPLDLLRMWHTKIEAWILNEAGIEQPAEDGTPGLRVVR